VAAGAASLGGARASDGAPAGLLLRAALGLQVELLQDCYSEEEVTV
jgi:hypothetical protein